LEDGDNTSLWDNGDVERRWTETDCKEGSLDPV